MDLLHALGERVGAAALRELPQLGLATALAESRPALPVPKQPT